MKKSITILALVALLLPLGLQAKKAEGPAKIHVMSYNIRMGNAKDGTNSWIYRYYATPMMIDDVAPDVIGMQEVVCDLDNPVNDQVKYLQTVMKKTYKFVGVGREDGRKKGEHMLIGYNKKTTALLKWGTYWLSETPDVPSKGWDAACYRTATWALMKDKKSGKLYYFVNTHLDHIGVQARKNGLALIVDRISKMNSEEYPMVLVGDFNMEESDRSLKGLNEIMLNARKSAAETDTRGTYNGWGTADQVIDYIYYHGFSSCPYFKVHTEKYDRFTYVSDHYPVHAELIF